jgi:predicted phosphoribosyltransferase
MPLQFHKRSEAGRILARRLEAFRGRPDVIVLALPRGGVPVGFEIAGHLDVPLDVFLVRKLGVPGQEELAFGAIASGGVRILNEDVIQMVGMSDQEMDAVAESEEDELVRRDRKYRAGGAPPSVRGKTVIVVDDGLATGATMLAAIRAIRKLNPARIVTAVPLAARDTCRYLAPRVDELVCLESPEPFHAVGIWYEDFSQVTDDQVKDLLGRRARAHAPTPAP